MCAVKVDLDVVRAFWEDEIIASNLYNFMRRKAKPKDKDLFKKLSDMELGHAKIWNNLAEKMFNKRFKIGLWLKIKIFFHKLLALIMPLTFMINYLELGEKTATLEYSKFLADVESDADLTKMVKEVIYDEVKHEITFIEMLVGEKSNISKVKDAIYGMTDSLVEILALVIGLAGVIISPITIGLAGLLAAIGGTFSMTAGAYLSAKSQNDIYEGEVMELKMKELVAPKLLKEDIKYSLLDKGVDEKSVEKIVESISDDEGILSNLAKILAVEETPTNPKDVAITTGVYYILGALPAVLPFFIGGFLGLNTVTIAIIAVLSASVLSFFAGIFTAILSGIDIKRKAVENVVITIGSALATYTIGYIAKTIFGIQV